MMAASDCAATPSRWLGLLRDMASGGFPWRGEWIVAAFDWIVCSDESGLQGGARWMALSGFTGKPNHWEVFERRWGSILKRYNVRDFHAKDFFARGAGGERVGRYVRFSDPSQEDTYSDWPDQKADGFLDDLTDAIAQSQLLMVGAMVDVRDFDQYTWGERRHLTGGGYGLMNGRIVWLAHGAPSKPYFLVFQHVLAEAADIAKVGQKIRFVFDEQKVYKGGALAQFHRLKEAKGVKRRYRRCLGAIAYQQRHELGGLQAADLYVHCCHRFQARPAGTGDQRNGVFRRITTECGVGKLRIYNKKMMEKLLDDMKTPGGRDWLRAQRPPTQPRRPKRR